MVIMKNSFAVFWRSRSHSRQFHADGWKWSPAESPVAVAGRFRDAFPHDIICSLRDGSGRFVAFKESRA